MLMRVNRRMNDDRGFTLIELMVVVIIVGVLAAIAIPLYTGYIKNARTSEGTARLAAVMTAAKAYHQANDAWPADFGVAGFYGDGTQTEHFTYSITQAGFTVTATGRDVDGMSGVTITMTCANPEDEGTLSITGL
jgi:prepilin-type N-terminal cleavage/methylation domain-containing protein